MKVKEAVKEPKLTRKRCAFNINLLRLQYPMVPVACSKKPFLPPTCPVFTTKLLRRGRCPSVYWIFYHCKILQSHMCASPCTSGALTLMFIPHLTTLLHCRLGQRVLVVKAEVVIEDEIIPIEAFGWMGRR